MSLLGLTVAAPASALENPAIQVHLADGTSLLLLSWTFSYEYQSWRSGEAPSLGTTARRDTKELWTGKKAIPLGSQALELQYVDRMREVDGQAAKVPIAHGFALVSGDGKRNSIKAEPPHPDLPTCEDRRSGARSASSACSATPRWWSVRRRPTSGW